MHKKRVPAVEGNNAIIEVRKSFGYFHESLLSEVIEDDWVPAMSYVTACDEVKVCEGHLLLFLACI
jgi:hypothetical protein